MRTSLAVVLMVVAAACAPTLTPRQQRVYEAFDACNREVGNAMRLEYVNPDGSFKWRGSNTETEGPRFQNCLRTRYGFRFAGDADYRGQGPPR